MTSWFDTMRSLGAYIAVGILGLVALGAVFRIVQGWRQTDASKNWPAIPGTVLSASVAAGRVAGRNGVSYYPVVMYEYTIDGQRYVGNRIGFGSQVGVGIQSLAGRSLDNYPVGGTIPVYYNPDNPADAVLERSASGNWGNFLLLGVLLVAMVIILTSFAGVRLPFAR